MGSSSPALLRWPSHQRFHQFSPSSERQTVSRPGPEPAPVLPRHLALQLPCCRNPLPAGRHSPATMPQSPSSRCGLPNPPHAGRSPVLLPPVRSKPPCRIGTKAIGLRPPASLRPKPLVAPFLVRRLSERPVDRLSNEVFHHRACALGPAESLFSRHPVGSVQDNSLRDCYSQV